MGMLHRAGVDVGNVTDAKSIENPTGFYEIREYQKFIRENYGPHVRPFAQQYSPELLRTATAEAKIGEIMERAFPGNPRVIAAKAMHYCPIPLFQYANCDVRVICMRRNTEDQARSIVKMWGKGDALEIQKWLEDCYLWTNRFREYYQFCPYLDVTFANMLWHPEVVARDIVDFCGLDVSAEQRDRMKSLINHEFSRSSHA